MARHVRTVELWSSAPDPDMRKRKRLMEEELLNKISVKNELIEFHPAILALRLKRSKFYVSMTYCRTHPTAQEVLPKLHDPWSVDDPGLRQISNVVRRGPRDNFLPNLIKPRTQIQVQEYPPTDMEYHDRRAAASDRLTKFFGDWTAYNRIAFPLPVRRQPRLSVFDNQRTGSRGSLINLTQGHSRRKSSSSTTSSGSEVKRDIYTVPKRRKKFDRWRDVVREVRLHLQAARMQLPEWLPRSDLRIYVSSTPDLQEEREFLEQVAYPRLQELCEELGLNCHVVDMRSGAESYWARVERSELTRFSSKISLRRNQETMIKENIIGVEAFDDVYRLDSNQVPPVYIKQAINPVEEYQSPEEVEQILYNALSLAVSIISVKKHPDEHADIDFYKWSAVVKEIETGLFTCYTPKRDTLCLMMDADDVKDVVMETASPIQRLRHKIFHHYKQFVSLNNLISFQSSKKSVAYLRYQVHHKEYDITQQLTEGSEAIQHVRVALAETKNNSRNVDTVSVIKNILETNETAPKVILIWGQSGTGKTNIASHVAASSILWQPKRKVVFRCLGTTLRSSSLFRLLESLIKQLSFLFSLSVEMPNDMSLQQIVALFCHTLTSVHVKNAGSCDLLLILDQIDRLPDLNAHYLLRILDSVAAGVTLILTLQTQNSLLNIVKSHRNVNTISTKYMNLEEVSKHLTDNLTTVRRVLTSDQLQSSLNAVSSDITPLHCQMLFQITRWWPSHTLPELEPFSDKLDRNFIVFIETIERELGHAFTRYALSFLASAKHGLADQEILHLLSKDVDLLNEIKEENQESVSVVDGFPYQYQISRLITRIGQFLTSIKLEGETVYLITAKHFVNAISAKYFNDSFLATVHARLANFFIFIRRGLLLNSKDISEQNHRQLLKYHWRTLRCVPYHLCHSSTDTSYVWAKLKEKVFFNFAWLVNQVYAGCFNELVDDISYALDNVSLDPDVQYLQKVLISVRHTVIYNPLSLAAVFASINTEASQSVHDSAKTVVAEARVWLKQVHHQVLVPVSYTSDKISRLTEKENCILNVTNIKPIIGTDRILVQRIRNLSILDMLSHEEVPLASISSDITSFYLNEEGKVVVLTVDASSKFAVDIFEINDTRVKTVQLGSSGVLWLDIRSLTASYFATSLGIKRIDLEKASVTNILNTKNAWSVSCISLSKPEKVLTVTVSDQTKIESFSIQDITKTKSVTLKNEPPNRYCKPLLSTKDGRYMIYITERQAVAIDMSTLKVANIYTYNGLPIVNVELSRSHEHVFLAYANGAITCHVLNSGSQSMTTKIKPKSQCTSSEIQDKSRVKNNNKKDDHVETLTSLVTSEDDHFLFCGTDFGHVYVIHVPTGLQLVDITTQQEAIKQIIYLTSRSHFQQIITMDTRETARHWNLRPLLKQARMILEVYITDSDLINEEKTKMDLNTYFAEYENNKQNRIFLNGPDITAFYQVPADDIFTDLADLDPAFGMLNDWEITGRIFDLCDHLTTLVSANELGGVILTVSDDFRLAKWNLQSGSLLWSKKLPCHGEAIREIYSVFYDQAVLLVQQSQTRRDFTISVVYTGDYNKMMSRDKVASFWMSIDRTHVMLMCQDLEHTSGTKLYRWDLINTKEESCECQHPTDSWQSRKGYMRVTSFSPHLRHNVCLVTLEDDVTKVQSKWPDKHTSITFSNSDLPPDHNIDYHERNSVNSFDTCNDSRRSSPYSMHSISRRKMHEPDLTPPLTDELHNLSDSFTSQNAPDFKQKSAEKNQSESSFNIRESTEVSPENDVLKNITSYIYWTKVCSNNVKSEDTQEHSLTNNDQMKSPHINIPKSTNRASPTSYKHKTDNQSQQNVLVKDLPTDSDTIHEQNKVNINMEMPSNLKHSEVIIHLQVTSFCFVGEQSMLVGTSSQHLLILNLPSFHPFYALGIQGPKCGDVITEIFLKDVHTPHRGAITFVTASEDMKVLISSDQSVVCLWDSQNRTLTMKIELTAEKISHMAVSKDAVIVAIATNNRTIHLWTPLEVREIANYMTTFDIVDLQMTCDCHKVIVRGINPEGKHILEIFDILNVDDILVNVDSRKELRQHERRENLVNERMTGRQETDNKRKISVLNAINEDV